MCGRFETKKLDQVVIEKLREKQIPLKIDNDLIERNTEIGTPGSKILSFLTQNDVYFVTKANWGIKFDTFPHLIFNSKIETIKEKAYWMKLFTENKCIIPMSSYFEPNPDKKKKTKFRISLPNKDVFYTAGIYYLDKNKKVNASMITTVPNKVISDIHHRMPIILDTLDEALNYLHDDVNKNLERCVSYDDKKELVIEEVKP
jgi:putative SOS response-associated peptidase YedK